MKILLIGDNRNRKNFGCRGTSIALSQLISKKHEKIGSIFGTFTANKGNVFYIPGLPKIAYKIIGKLPGWKYIRTIWWKVVLKLFTTKNGLIFDYARNNPEKSLKNFLRCLPANQHLEEFNLLNYNFEGAVFNGEGTMIMTNPPRREALNYLMLSYWAKKLNKKVFFINAMFSDCPETGRNSKTVNEADKVFSKCDALIVRDFDSLKYVNDNLTSCKAHYVPDALFTWDKYINDLHKITNGRYYLPFENENDENFEIFDFTKPYICLSGSSLSAWYQKKAKASYSILVNKLKNAFDIPVFIVQACSGDRFLIDVAKQTGTPILKAEIPIIAAAKILANASLYISGRYHPSIMASLGGTPCIFLGSNSHKTYSLQKILKYQEIKEFSALPDEVECNKIVSFAKTRLENYTIEKKENYTIAKELSIKSEDVLNFIQ